jgi:diguanylate cyclase (GGDEF)-like protein
VLVGRHGQEFAIEDTASPVQDRSARPLGAVMVFRDVTAARSAATDMSHIAHHDFLTGLPNRRALNERLVQAIASAIRHDKPLAVMFIDLDGFKGVNDSLGHLAGDQLLQSVSRRLVDCVRGSDTVSRQGGDEFIVLLAELSHREDAGAVAGKMLASLKLPHHVGLHGISCGASVGISVFPEDGADASTLLKNADAALLGVKAEQPGTYRFFSEPDPLR